MINRGEILCFLIFFFFLIRTRSVSLCNPNDLSSLQGFSNGLNSTVPSWSLGGSACCGWTGVQCDGNGRVIGLDLSNMSLKGPVSDSLAGLDQLTRLNLSSNSLTGLVPSRLFRLRQLEELDLSSNELSGRLSSSVSNLSNLAQLDLSLNGFSGSIPNVLAGLTKLESFSAQSNGFTGPLPSSLSNLSSLKVLNLRNNSLSGGISLNFTSMPRLSFIDLSSNSFTGRIPHELSQCSELQTLNLANNSLAGEIPDSFKNLASLSCLSLSKNALTNISSALGTLQHCPNLTNLVLTRNFFGEAMPAVGIRGFRNMEVLVIPNCELSGSVPAWLAGSAKLKVLDLSWNRLEGKIPPWIGSLDHLFYLDLSNNSLAGEIPVALTLMKGLTVVENSSQDVSVQNFPFYIKRNTTSKGLQYKQVSSFPPSLILSSNLLVGPVLSGFGHLKMLHVLDLSKNRLSGSIPDELSSMSSLETLDLSHNRLTGGIPASLIRLSFLSRFDVSYNGLAGTVPSGGQFSTFSPAAFEGNPGLCNPRSPSSPCAAGGPVRPAGRPGKNKAVIVGMALGIGLGTALLLAVVYLVVSRRTRSRIQGDAAREEAGANGHLETAGSTLVLLFQNKDNKEITIGDIMKATDGFSQANIIGCGGFGLVYRATLPDGSKVAIKRLSGDFGQMEREFHAEVEALSRAQHPNLVLLQGYCKIRNDRLLIYSYMENGSLDYWLHERFEQGSALDWATRLRVAQGSARGLAYLHQHCQPHILHRDIKSSNILLDGSFEAHLADFGLARLVLPYDTHVTTDLVGTLGYIPPEYGQSSVATFKGDVYSFGVVLLELLTGKRPVDMSKPKGSRDLISWAAQMKKEKREAEVFDPFVYDKEHDGQMNKMLEIALLCLSNSPKLRPLTHQLVTWLDNIALDGQLIV